MQKCVKKRFINPDSSSLTTLPARLKKLAGGRRLNFDSLYIHDHLFSSITFLQCEKAPIESTLRIFIIDFARSLFFKTIQEDETNLSTLYHVQMKFCSAFSSIRVKFSTFFNSVLKLHNMYIKNVYLKKHLEMCQ